MDPFEREERKEEERVRVKKERRDFRKHQEAVRMYRSACVYGDVMMDDACYPGDG